MDTIQLINILPLELINKIRRLTYKPQNKILLNDITNYKNTLNKIKNIYYYYYLEEDLQDHIEWLINDIVAYLNDDVPTFSGYQKKYYDICKRNNRLKTNKDVEKFIANLDNQNCIKQINTYWSLLKKNEREYFINSAVLQLIDN